MPRFQYRAYDGRGLLALGHVNAASRDAADETLWTQGLTAFDLRLLDDERKRWWQRELFARVGKSRADLTDFTREFATLVGAELPLDDCLRILSDQATSSAMRTLAAGLRQDILDGTTLSNGLQKRSQIFSDEYVSIVRAGELGGALASAFQELATLLERRQEVRSKIQSALIYPGILLGLTVISLAVIMGVLIPSLAPVFAQAGKPLPATLQFLISAQSRWLDILIALSATAGAMGCALPIAFRKHHVRVFADRSKLKVPVTGRLLLQKETAQFARTLGTLLRAGVPLLSAATTAVGTLGNSYLATGMQRAIRRVGEGSSLNHGLHTENILPPLAERMIAVGEEAGKLDQTLLTLALVFEKQTQRTIDRLMTLLTPVLTVAIAILVGSLILAIMNAILSVNELAVQ